MGPRTQYLGIEQAYSPLIDDDDENNLGKHPNRRERMRVE
jgi:hypothetical protein